MDLQTVLSQVNDFSRVLSVWDLLEEAGQVRALQSLEPSTAEYFKSSLILIEREIIGIRSGSVKQPTSFAEFLAEFKQLIGCQRGSINDFIREKYSMFPNSHIQRKDISNEEAKAFLYCFKYLLDDNMEILLQKIGEDALYYLLLNAVVLVMIQGQYWQICGRSLELFFEDLRKGPKEDPTPQVPHNEPYKNAAAKLEAAQANKPKGPKIREYFKEYINRNHMFYCLHSNKKPTLFYKNPLTQRSREYTKLTPQEKVNPECLAQIGSKLRQEIFRERPLHPTLVNAFDVAAGEWAAKFSHVDVAKIFKNSCKIDKSFFPLKDEIKRFIRLKEADDKKISDFLSKLVKLDASSASVVRFVQVCIREMLPNRLVGAKNKEILVASAGECVRLKKFETLSFREVYRKLKYNDIPWLRKPCHQRQVRAVVEENNLIFRQFLYFFFNKIVVELVRANFYATEKHNEHNKIFFYSKPVWYLITQTSMLNLAALNIEKLRPEDPRPEELKELDREKPTKPGKHNDMLDDFPCAKLRLVPKSDSVRPIMTFYKKFKDPKQNKLLKVGAYLKNAKIVLRGWRRILGETIGYAVFDNYQILDKYALYKKKWNEKEKPSTFYSTMDIQKCYDSVNIELLFELLRRENVFKNFYLISEFFKVTRNRRYAFRKSPHEKEEPEGKKGVKKPMKAKQTLKKGSSSKMVDELATLASRVDPKFDLNSLFIFKQRNSAIPLHEASNMANMVQDEPQKEGFTIFLDRPRKRLVSKEDLLESIKFVCYQVRIKFGNQVYRLKKGLPQGLSISSVLSSFYYAVLEQRHLNSIYDGQRLGTNELIMRLTDDYLIMSPEQQRVREILDRLLECANQYGFSFNQKKLTTNFQYRDYDPAAASAAKPDEPSKEKRAKWIGKLIDLDSLEMEHVQVLDYRQIFYTISTNITFLEKFPAQIIKSKLKSFILNHNLFYLDARVNSKDKMMDILRKVIITSYLKTRTYLSKVLLNKKTGHERIMAVKIIEALIDCSIAVVKLLEGNGPPRPLDKQVCREIYELFYGTFLECLRIDQTSRSKRCLYWMMATQIPEARFDNWMGRHIEGLTLIF